MKKLALLVTFASLLTACGEATVSTPTTTVTPAPTGKAYTITDVSAHNQATDCWMVIHDKVYNVTDFVKTAQHPGGPVITQGCGKDATTLFEDRPGEGTPHQPETRTLLASFYIGDLKK